MIKAKATMADGRPLYVFGLSARNIELMRAGRPIKFDLEPMGGKGAIFITVGATEEAITEQLNEFIRPELRGDAPTGGSA